MLATFLCLLPLSLRLIMFENISPLSVSFSSGLVVAVDGVVVVVVVVVVVAVDGVAVVVVVEDG